MSTTARAVFGCRQQAWWREPRGRWSCSIPGCVEQCLSAGLTDGRTTCLWAAWKILRVLGREPEDPLAAAFEKTSLPRPQPQSHGRGRVSLLAAFGGKRTTEGRGTGRYFAPEPQPPALTKNGRRQLRWVFLSSGTGKRTRLGLAGGRPGLSLATGPDGIVAVPARQCKCLRRGRERNTDGGGDPITAAGASGRTA